MSESGREGGWELSRAFEVESQASAALPERLRGKGIAVAKRRLTRQE